MLIRWLYSLVHGMVYVNGIWSMFVVHSLTHGSYHIRVSDTIVCLFKIMEHLHTQLQFVTWAGHTSVYVSKLNLLFLHTTSMRYTI